MIKTRQQDKPYLLALLVSLVILTIVESRSAIAEPSAEPDSKSAQTETPAQPQTPSDGKDRSKASTQETSTAPVSPPPAPPVVKMECSPNPAPVAMPVTCVVTITHASSITVQVTAPPNAESGAASLPVPNGQGELTTQRIFTMRQLELNKPLRVKGVQVRWSAVGGHKGVIDLPQQKIPTKVRLMGVSDPRVRDLQTPTGQRIEEGADSAKVIQAREAFWQRHAPPSLTEKNWSLIIILGAIGVTLVGGLIGWLIRLWFEARNRRKAPYVDPRPAHIIAYEALEQLKRAKLIEEGAFKTYSHRLSEILRAYFSKRYDINGLEMTSDELRETLKRENLNKGARLALEDFLSDTDLIKFADLSTSAHALEESEQRVYRIIETTKVQEEVVQGEVIDEETQSQESSKGREASK